MTEESSHNTGRRAVLGTIGSIGTVGLVGKRARATPASKETPETYARHGTLGETFEDPVNFRHLADTTAAQRRWDRYERTGDRGEILTPHLQNFLSDGSGEVDITVTTTGRRSTVRSNGPFSRTINGWEPTPAEVKQLAEYGDIRFVPSVISTKVGLANVAIEDLSELAELPFVLELGYDPKVRQAGNASVTTSSVSVPTIDDLKTSSHCDFDSVFSSLNSDIRIGYFSGGYPYEDGGSTTSFSKNWAESQGIDTGLCKDFTSSGGWQDADNHAANVLDTTAYMLDGKTDGDHHVVLRTYDGDVSASEWRNAIEYAVTNDIPASVTALETAANEPYCTSTLCEELDSYSSAGYVMTAATGNDDKTDEVLHPATSYHCIGVGGYLGSCSGGYEEWSDPDYDFGSNYGYIDYYSNNFGTAYCTWCYEDDGGYGFKGNVYSAYSFTTDAGNEISGTSFASPVAGAGAALNASAKGSMSYDNRVDLYDSMSDVSVCPDEASRNGDVLNAPELV